MIDLAELAKNKRLLAEAEAILEEKNRLDNSFAGQRKKLVEQKRQIEADIIRWRARLDYLLHGSATRQLQEQAADLRKSAKWAIYTLQRDQQDMVAQVEAMDAVIAAAEGPLDKALAELEKSKFLASNYAQAKNDFDTRSRRCRALENQLAALENGYAEAVQQAQDELQRLGGE